ncbi:hypothetical protein DFJ74DRAFT_505875 [Hyaloraphidium curvatum]|nr:hypothetical protein DFJ74DRAFT_505875 [Hyaloraphidium curvatum]
MHSISIFDLHDYVEKALGPGTTFYQAIGVESSASERDISRAWRKLALTLHPDKNPDKAAQELYQHLTSVVELLKDPEGRERYDLHLRVGIPKWRGTGYFYHRYRPSLGVVMVFLAIFATVVQFISGWAKYAYDKYQLAQIMEEVNQINVGKLRRNVKKQTGGSVNRSELKSQTPLELIAEAHGISVDHLKPTKPRMRDIWLFTLPVWLVRTVYNLPSSYRAYRQRKAEEREWALEMDRRYAEERRALELERDARRAEEEVRRQRDEEKKQRRKQKAIAAGEEQRKRKEEAAKRLDPFQAKAEPSSSSSSSEEGDSVSDADGADTADGDFDAGAVRQRRARASEETDVAGGGAKRDAKPGKGVNTSPTWTAEEVSKLSQLTKKFPGGTPGRWVRIAGDLNREVDAVVEMNRRLMENPRLMTEGYLPKGTEGFSAE